MNKKLTLAALSALMLTACSNDDLLPVAGLGEPTEVTFTVGIPDGLQTRAENAVVGKGLSVNRLYVTAISPTGERVTQAIGATSTDKAFENHKTQSVVLNLVKGDTYDIIFWADNANSPYEYDATKGTVTVKDYSKLKTNDETQDAFYYYYEGFQALDNTGKTVTLNRPFAQVNIACTEDDTKAASALGINVAETAVNIAFDAYPTLNLISGEMTGTPTTYTVATPLAYEKTTKPADQLMVNGTAYDYLACFYVLAGTSGNVLTNVNFQFDSNTGNRDYSNIPVKRNYRTNIIGQILTNPYDFTVILDEAFAPNDYNVEVNPEPLKPNASGKYEISSYADMVNVAATIAEFKPNEVNGKMTFVLNSDIDMAGSDWPALRLSWVEFDGNGHTISNLNCKPNEQGQSGFASYSGGAGMLLKNLTLKNITTTGAQAGVVSGYTDGGAKFENVHIQGVNNVYFQANPNETYNGVGAIVGTVGGDINHLEGVTIDNGAVVNLYAYGLTTDNAKFDKFAYYVLSSATTNIVNNGTIKVYSDNPAYFMPEKNAAGEYLITSPEEFTCMLSSLLSNGGTFNIESNLDMTGVTIPEVAKYSKRITINGNDKTISNVTMNGSEYAALFGKNNGTTTISNLTVANSTFSSDSQDDESSAGAFLAFTDFSAVINITECKLINVTVNKAHYVGGFVGYSSGTNFHATDCEISGCTIGNEYFDIAKNKNNGHAGGFIGRTDGGTLTNCKIEETTFNAVTDRVGIYAGSITNGRTLTATGCSYSNITGITALIGLNGGTFNNN